MLPDPSLPDWRAIFPAQITDRLLVEPDDEDEEDYYLYGWRELSINPRTGALIEGQPPRYGTTDNSPAYAMNNATLEVGDQVWLRLRGDRGGMYVYEAMPAAAASAIVHVRPISSVLDADGNYSAWISVFTPPSTWDDIETTVKVRSANGDLLENTGVRYLARYAGVNGSGEAVYVTDRQGGITAYEGTSGTPPYTESPFLRLLRANQTTGLTVSAISGGLQLSCLEASATQSGVVSTSGTQVFGGDKEFNGQVELHSNTYHDSGEFKFQANVRFRDASVITWDAIPASSGSAGVAGHFAADSTYLYYCISTNSWKRVAWDATPW